MKNTAHGFPFGPWRFRLVQACAAALALLLAPTAWAGKESKESAASKARKAGLTGDYGLAILSELFVKTKEPIWLFNQGRCFEQNGKYEEAIEDASFLYWADSAGAIYRCPTNDLANCKDKKVLLTTGAATTGFFQDAKNLYWGTLGTTENQNGKLLRMAK